MLVTSQTRKIAFGLALAIVLYAEGSMAGGLGIPLDGFLTTFQTFVVGIGLIIGLVGLTGYVGSLMDNPFANILAGSVGFFTKAAATRGRIMNCLA